MTGHRVTVSFVVRGSEKQAVRAYPVDPWVWGFCTGYLAVWRVLRLFGVDLDD